MKAAYGEAYGPPESPHTKDLPRRQSVDAVGGGVTTFAVGERVCESALILVGDQP